MWAISVNGLVGYVMLITYCFTLGNLDDILSTQTGYPFIQAFYNGTKSHAGASIMTAIIIVSMTSSVISNLASASRQTWSFARDKGLPFSSFISHVSVLSNL
jgi:choline transport protein